MSTSTAPVQPCRILVADDVEINREILRVALGKQGHQVVLVVDGAQALERACEELFDLILMDVQMPVMDGLEATRRIRQLPAPYGSTRIVGLTATYNHSQRDLYLHTGVQDCLPKPRLGAARRGDRALQSQRH